MTDDDLLGPGDVAELLGVKRDTVMKWVQRRRIPTADSTVDGKPAWRRSTVVRWAEETGRG